MLRFHCHFFNQCDLQLRDTLANNLIIHSASVKIVRSPFRWKFLRMSNQILQWNFSTTSDLDPSASSHVDCTSLATRLHLFATRLIFKLLTFNEYLNSTDEKKRQITVYFNNVFAWENHELKTAAFSTDSRTRKEILNKGTRLPTREY